MVKLTEEQAKSIIRDTRTFREIALEHGVSEATVSHVKSGFTWRHLERPTKPVRRVSQSASVKRRRGRDGVHGNAKLSEAQAKAIIADERKHEEIARDYGISLTNVAAIKDGKSWKHLKRPERTRLPRKGEHHGSAKLTEEQAKAIIPDPRKYKVIGEAHGISASVVGQIKAGFLWKHLDRSNVVRRRRGADAPVRKLKSREDSR